MNWLYDSRWQIQYDVDGNFSIKCCSFIYLGRTLSANGKSVEDIKNKIVQWKCVLQELNSFS